MNSVVSNEHMDQIKKNKNWTRGGEDDLPLIVSTSTCSSTGITGVPSQLIKQIFPHSLVGYLQEQHLFLISPINNYAVDLNYI